MREPYDAKDMTEQELTAKVGLTPLQIIERAVAHPVRWETGTPRWSAVGSIFSLGSNSSIAICRAAGQDPNDIKLRNGRVKKATRPAEPVVAREGR